LAEFYLPTLRTSLLETARRASRNNLLFTLDEMNTLPDEQLELWRAQSYGMVLYIAQQIGVQNLFELARDSATFTTAYETAMGQPLTRLTGNWERWIFTNAAENAYAYNPHMAVTATPTMTPTPTEPPPIHPPRRQR
jgi:hypothetical protein